MISCGSGWWDVINWGSTGLDRLRTGILRVFRGNSIHRMLLVLLGYERMPLLSMLRNALDRWKSRAGGVRVMHRLILALPLLLESVVNIRLRL